MRRINVSLGAWLPIVRTLPTGGGEFALSYDDAPSPDSTPRLLDVLDVHSARATFFVTGFRAAEHPDIVGEIVRRGHEVYAHGWHHVRHDKLPADEMIGSLEQTEDLLRRWRRTPCPYLVRLPHHGGFRRSRVHRALRGWLPGAQYAHGSVEWPDYLVCTRCKTQSDVEQQCRAAVTDLFTTASLDGAILILHDKPVGMPEAYSAEVTVRLSDILLSEAGQRGLRAVPIEPAPLIQSLRSRFLFT